MNDQTAFRRIAAISAILSAPLALGAFIIATLGVEFDFELMSDQARRAADRIPHDGTCAGHPRSRLHRRAASGA